MNRPRSWDHHKPCPGGCGNLSDECACRRPNPLGSMTITEPIGSSYVAPHRSVAEAGLIASMDEAPPAKLQDHTRRALFAEMTSQGITDADTQRSAMSHILQREVVSRASLTEDEGHTLLDSLRARRRLIEIAMIMEGTDR